MKFATDISRQMSSVAQMSAGIAQLAAGDLTALIPNPLDSSIEQTKIEFNSAVDQLRDVMTSIVSSASSTAGNAQQLRAVSNDIARRTEQQAPALEDTAAALEEITTTVSESSIRAQQAG